MTAATRLRMLPDMMDEPRTKQVFRVVLAIFMTLIGVAHFLHEREFTAMVPAWLPAPRLLVQLSGLCEVAGGVGLLLPPVQRAAAIGLVLLYIAVFPANLNMAIHHLSPPGMHIPSAVLWWRLPLQLPLIAWAWWMSRPSRSSRGSQSSQ